MAADPSYFVGDTDSDFQDSDNWSASSGGAGGSGVPTATEKAIFDGNSPACTLTANIACKGIDLQAGFSNTLDLDVYDANLGTDGFVQAGGTITLGTGTVNVYGNITITAGTFTAETSTVIHDGGSGTTIDADGVSFNDFKVDLVGAWAYTISASFDIAGDLHLLTFGSMSGTAYTITLAGDLYTEVNSSGSVTVKFDGGTDQTIYPNTPYNRIPQVEIAKGGGTLYADDDFSFTQDWTRTSGDLDLQGYGVKMYASANAVIDDALTTFNDFALSTGYWFTVTDKMTIAGEFHIDTSGNLVGGDIECQGDVKVSDTIVGGSATIVFNGTGDQDFYVDKAGGSGTVSRVKIDKASGTFYVFDVLTVYGNATTNPWQYVRGDYDAGTSTIVIGASGGAPDLFSGAYHFYNLETLVGGWGLTITGDCWVDGELYFNTIANLLGDTIKLAGNLKSTEAGIGGGCTIEFIGTGTQTITGAGQDWPSGNWTIDKPSGDVVLATAIVLNGAGQDLIIVEGTLDLAGYDLTVPDIIETGADGVLKAKGDETLTATTKTHGGTMVFYDGAVTAVVDNFGTVFNDLELGASKTHNFTFGVGNQITVNGILSSAGTSSTRAVLRSTSDGNRWYIDLQGYSVLEDAADVKDSNASSGKDIYAIGSLDSGNNTAEWIFSAAAAGGRRPTLRAHNV